MGFFYWSKIHITQIHHFKVNNIIPSFRYFKACTNSHTVLNVKAVINQTGFALYFCVLFLHNERLNWNFPPRRWLIFRVTTSGWVITHSMLFISSCGILRDAVQCDLHEVEPLICQGPRWYQCSCAVCLSQWWRVTSVPPRKSVTGNLILPH